MDETAQLNKEQWHRYLELTKNSNTAAQYDRMFNLHHRDLLTQDGLEDFLISKKKGDEGINPLYKGFVKAIIECFKLNLIIPKDTRKNQNIQEETKFLTKEEIDLIITQAPHRISIIVQLFFETGLRLRELFNAKRKDIDLTTRTIKGIGKGNKKFNEKFSQNMADILNALFKGNEDEIERTTQRIKEINETLRRLENKE